MKNRFESFSRRAVLAFSLGAALIAAAPAALAAPERLNVEIVADYPHDPDAFTQGLFFDDGRLIESTGLIGRSTLREVELETGEVLRLVRLPDDVFGEGVAKWEDRIVGLTWQAGIGFVFDAETFEARETFSYPGEGWGLTSDGERLIMSDGTDALRFLDPETLEETGRVSVTVNGRPLIYLNELEWVDGAVLANVWRSDFLVRIDPESGTVTGVADLSVLRAALGGDARAESSNGIAYDPQTGRLFATGKYWPKLFEIRLIPADASP